jgi:gamma-glutamyltranspeptidase/glutathione hydrolase
LYKENAWRFLELNTLKTTKVSCGHPASSKAALQIMAEGGNAFDAIIAAGFTSAISEQALTSLGGGGFLLANTSLGEEVLFDFFSDTPGKGVQDSSLEPHFFPVTIKFSGSDQDFNIGLGSVAVPGNLKGFLHVHQRLGKLPLSMVVKPAIKAARDGVVLNKRQSQFMKLLYPIMTLTESGRNLFEPDGNYLQEGMISKNIALADFLERLPDGEADSFYSGPIAETIAQDMRDGQGLLTVADLAEYKVIEREPLSIFYRGKKILTNPPPSFGGTLIGATLQLMENIPFADMKWGSAQHLGTITTILKEIDKHRDETVLDPNADPAKWLDDASGRVRQFSRGTTHISVSDGLGNHASMTTSNGEGSGYLVPGTGIMLNNMMGEDDLHPDGFHASSPGMRVSSMMSPSMLIGEQGLEMVVGSGGSKRIRTAIPQVISNVIDFGIPIEDAVTLPRIHWDGALLQIEPGYSSDHIAALKKSWPVNIWSETNVYFGGVHAIYNGIPGGDPRRGGDARVGQQG